VASLDLLFKYLLIIDLRFDTMLHSNLGNENSVAGHIKRSRGQQIPTPVLIIYEISFFSPVRIPC